ncbi:hypothetical protein EZV62_001717 [Acer yangbiense]|uniref:FAR1 domain-containing protein n=1 Tax=Acer yangbiense TaxID=1000413 RepID=A0A5C7IVM7_9ROSI|nr:hypothetical protein EZV62_001717 [Acer yangbiense]
MDFVTDKGDFSEIALGSLTSRFLGWFFCLIRAISRRSMGARPGVVNLSVLHNGFLPDKGDLGASDMSHGMFTNGTGHLDLNNEGHSRWHEADTTQTDNEEYNPNDTYNNNEWPFHVPFAHDIMGKEFISVTDADEFYKKNSYGMRFSMRKDRVREPRGQTREGCRASLKINLDREKMLWVVTEFVTEHSHKLSPGNHSQFLRSHRNVKDCDIAQVQSLRSVGVKTCQVMYQLLDQCGSYAAIRHTKRDLQNRLDTIRRFVSYNSDADSIIYYMTAKSEMDPGFFFRCTILEDGSIVIDGDNAMSKAISSVMHSAVRRLCSWHLERNVQMNVEWNTLEARRGFHLAGHCAMHEAPQIWRV